jgi:hypothetical protein
MGDRPQAGKKKPRSPGGAAGREENQQDDQRLIQSVMDGWKNIAHPRIAVLFQFNLVVQTGHREVISG